jgi:long-chain acyl-CoA synthetase
VNLASIVGPHPASRPALISGDDVVTYGELRSEVDRFRAGLVAAGLGPGDRAALLAGNEPAFVVGYLAVLGAGGIAVPLNPAAPAAELERDLAATTPAALVVGHEGAAGAGAIDRSRFRFVIAADGVDLDGATPVAAFGAEPATPIVDRNAADVAVLMFTAGTAGAPKAAMLTHGNLVANLEQVQRHPGRTTRADDVTLGVLPLFHIFGLNVVLGLTLAAGGAVVLVDRFDAATVAEIIERHRITVVPGVPTMFAALAAEPRVTAHTMATVRLAVSGAAPLSADVAAAAQQRLGLVLHEGYGLTEASPVVTSSVLDADAGSHRGSPFGSVGVPVPGVEVRLIDEEGEDALVGDPGEIWVRGPNVFAGYWDDEAASAEALTPEGWLRTGDIAVAGDDGELFLVDRVKDLVIVSGFNVYPAEVEDVLRSHPAVAEAGVIGVADPYSGESVQAYVTIEPGATVTEAELIEYCARNLARYKCPTHITFVPALPRGAAGKLLRREIGR